MGVKKRLEEARTARSLRIAMMTPAWPRESFANGIVSYVASVIPEFEALGHSVELLSGVFADEYSSDHVINLSSLARKDPGFRRAWDRVRGRLTRQDPRLIRAGRVLGQALDQLSLAAAIDVIEMEESFGIARWMRPRQPVTKILRLHGPWAVNGLVYGVPMDEDFRRRSENEKLAGFLSDGITAPSRAMLDLTREAWGEELPDARAIFNPAPPVDVTKLWDPRRANSDRILFVGRFDRIKGADTVLLAFDQLAARRPNVELVFAGIADDFRDDAGRVWSFEEYVAEKLCTVGVRDRIQMLGFQEPHVLSDLRKDASVTIVASRFESCCNAILEAMSAGCPIVASRAGGIPELIEHERTGLLFEVEDVGGLVRGIEAMLNSSERAAEMGREAARFASTNLAPDRIARETIDFYRQVIDERPAKSEPRRGRP